MKDSNENNKQSNSISPLGQVKGAVKKMGIGKAIRKALLSLVMLLLPIILLAVVFYSVISLVADFFSGIVENIADFFTLDSNGAIIITDESIDKIIEAMKNDLNISPEDLNLLGDIDYNDPNQEEAIKEAERKYIRLFLEAQETTQTINDGGFLGTGLGSEGSVYINTVDEGANDTSNLKRMNVTSMDDLERKVANQSSDIWNYFSVNDEGKLVVPTMNSNQISLIAIDYKSMISQYSTPWNFFIDIEMIVQNPKFMEAFVDLVKDSRINLTVLYNTTYTKETIVHKYKVTETVDDGEGNEVEITRTETDTTVNEYTSKNPTLVITTANTWIYSREAVYKKNVSGPTESVYTEGDSDDNTTTTTEITTTAYVQDGVVKEEYNGGQKGEDGTFVGLLDKSFKIPNSSRTAKAGDSLVSGAEMLFSLLQQSANTQNWEEIMRYILYVYTGKSYGVTEFNFSIFNTSTFNAVSGSQLLTDYIHYFENGSGAPMNADGTKYIIHDDGAGNPTVGYGVDIFNSGYAELFIAAGYPTEIGGEVDKDFVDGLEKQQIKDKTDQINAIVGGLNLKGYQINALISRAYNCGVSGAVSVERGSPALNFVQSYQRYWNEETDDYFEQKKQNADFNHSLYTQYMSKPVTADGQYMPGLETRRKSEWTLFQTGYYDVLDKWHAEGGAIIEIADEIHKYMEANNYTYCVYGGNSYEECGKYGKSHGLNTTFEASKTGYHNSCCATYVSWVLQEAGYISDAEHQDGANNLRDLLLNKGFTRINSVSELQPGDIVCYSGHIEIYAGDGTVYNAGSGNAIRNSSPQTKSVSSMLFGLRAP